MSNPRPSFLTYDPYQGMKYKFKSGSADDYEEEELNWALYGLGCILVAIIVVLLVVIFIYFFAPASIVDPIADFLAGLGINVP